MIYGDLLNKEAFEWEMVINSKSKNKHWIPSGLIEKNSLENVKKDFYSFPSFIWSFYLRPPIQPILWPV